MNHPIPKNEQTAQEENQEGGHVENQPPTWFARNYRNDESDFIVDQYRRRQEPVVAAQQSEGDAYENYRQRMLERLREQETNQVTRAQMPPLPPRPTMPVDDIRAQDRQYGNTRAFSDRGASEGRSGNSRFVLFAGVTAILAGGAIGFAMTKYDQIVASADGMATYMASLMPAKAAPLAVPDRETSISKKPISIASLKVLMLREA